jgi:hypothetical protein
VSRLLVLWARPYHLPPEEVERWAREQIRLLVHAGHVERAVLTRLEHASTRHGCDWDWLAELEIAPGLSNHIDEWLGDLRLLGSQPAAVQVTEIVPLEDS